MTRFSRPLAVAALLCASATFAQTPAVTPVVRKVTPVKMTTKAFDVGEILAGTEGKAKEENVERLCRLIKGMVRPHTWDEMGGAGKLTFDARDCVLVVNHSPEAIAEVKNLLDSLQRLGEPITVQLRVVRSSGKESREALAKLFDAKGKEKMAFLSESDLKAVLEKCAADRTTTVMQAPRIAATAGQPASVAVCENKVFTTAWITKVVGVEVVLVGQNEAIETGTTFTAIATPSADGKFVELKVSFRDKQPKAVIPQLPFTTFITPKFADGSKGQPLPYTQFVQVPTFDEVKVDRTADVPDGGTVALFAGTCKTMKRSEFGPPVVARIPYLNRLFKNVGMDEVDESVVVFASVKRGNTESATVIPAGGATVPAADGELSKVLADYQRSCEMGKTNEAAHLAVQALAKDPTCFKK